jgi:transcriptional regulator with XRE-family HTH domain
MTVTKEIVRAVSALPRRGNTLKGQRKALGLSRAVLARILEVDPSTVYRQEAEDQMSMLWCYALRGIAAEAASKANKAILRERKADLARSDQLLGPTRLDAMGEKLTAEKMREAAREQAKPPTNPRRPRPLTPDQVTAAADRAEVRSKSGGSV